MNLEHSWVQFDVSYTYQAEIGNTVRHATLDHFFWDEDSSCKIVDAGVVHSVDNFSDHEPIYCVFDEAISVPKIEKKKSYVNKPSWKLSSDEEVYLLPCYIAEI